MACLFWAGKSEAQETWSLERCVKYAQESSLAVKQAQNTVRAAKLSEKQALANRLPNLNAGVDGGAQFGYRIDPTTNTFKNTQIGYNSLSLSTAMSVYSGGQIHNTIKQSKIDTEAAKAEAEQMVADLSLQVATAYLNILLNEEQLANVKRRVSQSQEQLKNTDKLIQVGTIPAADRLNILAQIATDEQSVVVSQNSVDMAYLTLKQLLQLEPDYNLAVERPQVEIPESVNPETYSLKPIYNTALGNQASIRAADLRLKSAEIGIKLAQAQGLPSVSIFANAGSNYSTAARNATLTGTQKVGQLVNVTGDFGFGPIDEDVTISQDVPVYDITKKPYFSQVRENFGQGVGINVNIPIYNNSRARIAVERAKLNILNTEIANTQTRQSLKNDIQTAIANAKSAKKQLEAAQKTAEATRTAYDNMLKRHNLGTINSLELTTARNNLDTSENNLLLARYDYIFKLKIIDFYLGKKITLN